jgi:carbamoyltransferase
MDDSGLALGAAFSVLSRDKKVRPYPVSSMYLGTSYSDEAVVKALDAAGLKYQKYDHVEKKIAELIHAKKVVARFNGAMEFGPRALGNRSILYEATNPEVNRWLNQRLGRTEFMPFAPVTLAEEADRCFRNLEGIRHPLKFMTITVDCTDWAIQHIPAVVHVDRTARPQLITEEDNPSYYRIVNEYYRLSGIPALVNTSFNMHEEPIVATPEDAIRAFVRGNLDCLAIHDYVVLKDGDEAGR